MSPQNHAWSAFSVSTPSCPTFSLDQIRTLQADAVRLCDGFEFRYHRDGRITWFSMRSEAEVPIADCAVLPTDQWWHLPGCDCAGCRNA